MSRFFLFPLLVLACFQTTLGQVKKAIPPLNPTGTYQLPARPYSDNRKNDWYTGTILVKQLDSISIVVSLETCKGAPSYNSGSLLDTLEYKENRALYHHAEDDTSCRITFYFTAKGVTVTQNQDNLNFGCDFGHAVFADGYYKKKSRKVPVIEKED